MKTVKVILPALILVAMGAGIYFFPVIKNKLTDAGDPTAANRAASTEAPLNMTNPASVYCNEHGGQSVIRTASDGSQSGVCVLADGKECDEWMYFRGECSTDDPLTPGTQKAIQAFLANKYNKPLSDVKITVEKEAGGYAAGSVLYGQGGPGESGMWLAIAGNRWDVVWDGNGSVDCSKLRLQYGFPDSILKPNFCD